MILKYLSACREVLLIMAGCPSPALWHSCAVLPHLTYRSTALCASVHGSLRTALAPHSFGTVHRFLFWLLQRSMPLPPHCRDGRHPALLFLWGLGSSAASTASSVLTVPCWPLLSHCLYTMIMFNL